MSAVLVVGAGMAGLATAAELRRRGVTVDVVERAPGLRMPSAGIMLHPNALACLRHLDPALSDRGHAVPRQLAVDADGTRTVVDWPTVWAARSPLAIHRRTLGELLLAAASAAATDTTDTGDASANAGPEPVRWSTAVEDLIQDTDGVTAMFADGDRRRYALVVGADGIHSTVRRAVDPDAEPRFTGHTFVRTTVAPGGPVPFPEWRVWRKPPYQFGAVAIGEGRMAVFLQIAGAQPVRLDAAEAATLLRTAGGTTADEARAVAAAIRAGDEVVTRAAFALTTRRSVHGRVVLVGDAAHAVSPTTTQGGGLAVEDAAVLGEEISRHGCTPAALAAFEERRRRRVGRFVRAADQHVALMEAVQRAPRARSQTTDSVKSVKSVESVKSSESGAGAPVDASRWFQRLYAPLSTAP